MTTIEHTAGDQTIESVGLKDFFSKKETKYEIEGLSIPFEELPGEYTIYIGLVSNGIIALSNYRLFVSEGKAFFNVPIGLIESVDYRDLFTLNFSCKDARTYRCTFVTNEKCLEWCRRLLDLMKIRNLTDAFAFAFYAWSHDEAIQSYDSNSPLSKPLSALDSREYCTSVWFDEEVMRVGFDLSQETKAWRISSANINYKLCDTYPQQHIVPYSITDEDIAKICDFRACNRYPTIVWRDRRTGVVLGRSSQPNVGLFWWRNTNDEAFIRAIALSAQLNPGTDSVQQSSCNTIGNQSIDQSQAECGKNVLIVDARSYAAAMANRAKGGGCECEEYYTSSTIMFMNLPNIHVVRKSFLALRQLCSLSDENWLTTLESSKWLNHIGNLLRSALIVADALKIEKKCVLVHCSDGWDRTPQITALAQIMLDPFYRTLQGFCILVEREWVDFGHKFADRCGQGVASADPNERCPIFIQWMDSVHQLLIQFPTAFQFNHCFLLKLAQHTYSCLFGDFLFNSDKQRGQHNMRYRTMSVWKWLLNSHNFHNHLYLPVDDVHILRPAYNVQDLQFWSSLYKTPLPTNAKPSVSMSIIDTMDAGISLDISSKSSKVSTDDDDDLPRRSTPTSDIGSDSFGFPLAFQSNLMRFEEEPISLQRMRHCSGGFQMLGEEEVKRRSNSLDRVTEYVRSIESSITTLHSLSLETIDSIDITKNNNILNEAKKLHPNDDYHKNESPVECQPNSVGNLLCKTSTNNLDLTKGYIDIYNLNNTTANLKVDLIAESNFKCNLINKNISENCLISPKQCKIELQWKDNQDIVATNAFKLNYLDVNNLSNLDENDIVIGSNLTKQRKSSLWTSNRGNNIIQDYSQLSLSIDVDGLIGFFDPIQSRVRDIMLQYERRIKLLELQLMKRQKCVCSIQQMSVRTSDAKDDTSSNDSGEPSSNTSIGSFELLTESQAELTLWIPDHIATHCSGCDKEFWAALRKHHCRSCGRVFCNECTKHSMPCPSQQLNVPVRVCKRCYETAE